MSVVKHKADQYWLVRTTELIMVKLNCCASVLLQVYLNCSWSGVLGYGEGKVMNCILLCITNGYYLVLQDSEGLGNKGYSHHYRARYTLPFTKAHNGALC